MYFQTPKTTQKIPLIFTYCHTHPSPSQFILYRFCPLTPIFLSISSLTIDDDYTSPLPYIPCYFVISGDTSYPSQITFTASVISTICQDVLAPVIILHVNYSCMALARIGYFIKFSVPGLNTRKDIGPNRIEGFVKMRAKKI